MSTLVKRLQNQVPRKLLSIEGGGIRGVMALEVLAKIEHILAEESEQGDDFRLAHYFDYIAGTSTGAVIAACLSLGFKVADVQGFYRDHANLVFAKAPIHKRIHHLYTDTHMAELLRATFGEETTLGSDRLLTLLLVIMRNASTDSPWPVSNNPFAKYNIGNDPGCNLNIPLWQLVRASTAAPGFFPPEKIELGKQSFLFVDGAVSVYNNPAFQLFLMSTLPCYWPHAAAQKVAPFPTGSDKLLLVSIGTGYSDNAATLITARDMHLLHNAQAVPHALISSAVAEQDLLCRVFGDCRFGHLIDSEVMDLVNAPGPGSLIDNAKLFSYIRYNPNLSQQGLDDLGITEFTSDDVNVLDNIGKIGELTQYGRTIAEHYVKKEHFNGFIPSQ